MTSASQVSVISKGCERLGMLPGSSVKPDNLETSLQSLGFQVGNMSFNLPSDSFSKTLLHFPPGHSQCGICFGEKRGAP